LTGFEIAVKTLWNGDRERRLEFPMAHLEGRSEMPDQATNPEQLNSDSLHSGAINVDGEGRSENGSDSTPSRLMGPPAANRHRLPDERPAITHHFSVGGHEGYLTVGLYPNGQPGEIFIRMAKEGSTIAGLMECFGTVVSVSLQHGVPLRVLCDKLSHTRFEPSGWTGNAELGYAKSIMDYLFRWLELRFLSGTQLALFSASSNHGNVPDEPGKVVPISSQAFQAGDGPACRSCGALMTPNGSCYVCKNCGGTSGCS
jgi:ribonucleoside-diphosphate reductase alpha chain